MSAPAFLTGASGALPSRTVAVPEALARAVIGGHDWQPAHQALAHADSARDQAERSLA
jgi:hypothetical protein